MNERAIVYLTTKTGKIDNDVINIIREQYDENTKIRFVFVQSPRIFNTKNGLTTLIEQYKNTGIVYMIKTEITKTAFETAALNGIPFYYLHKNKINKWEIFRVGTRNVGARNIKKAVAIYC